MLKLINVEKFRTKLKEQLIIIKHGLETETDQTKDMFETYFLFTQGKATKEDMALANKQFREVLKGLSLGIFVLLPFAPITIPFIIKLGRRLGVDIVPDGFKRKH